MDSLLSLIAILLQGLGLGIAVIIGGYVAVVTWCRITDALRERRDQQARVITLLKRIEFNTRSKS